MFNVLSGLQCQGLGDHVPMMFPRAYIYDLLFTNAGNAISVRSIFEHVPLDRGRIWTWQ
jgi:hypothetical protein